MASLSLRNVCKSYPGNVVALSNVDLSLVADEFVALVGPSGCGKTTLLRIIAGLEACDSGDVHFDGRAMNDVEPRHRNVALVFQENSLYPHLSVFENMAFPLRARKLARPEIAGRVQKAADQLEVGHLMNRRPQTLSGGERQRVALGRAWVRRPSVLLLDEPFSNLDAHLRRALRETLKRIRGDCPVTTVFVTHDQREALALGDRVAVMNGGRIVQIDTPTELLENPVNRLTASIIRDPPVNFLVGSVQGARFESPAISFDLRPDHAARLKPGPVVLGVRPEAIQAGPPPENTDSVVISVTRRASEFLGSSWETRLALEDGNEFIVLSSNAVRERDFHFDKEDIFFFADSDDGANLMT